MVRCKQHTAMARNRFSCSLTYYFVVVVLADYAGSKSSGDAIKKLKESSAANVSVKRNGTWSPIPTRELVPGDFVAVTIGMTIPADGIVVHDGEPLKLDYSSLTGEPLPEKKGKGDAILSGAVVLVGEGEMVRRYSAQFRVNLLFGRE